MSLIHAIYENGIFRPLEPVDFPEGSRVKLCKLEILVAEGDDGMDAIYEILDRRHSTGHTDTAERHNEHQPYVDRYVPRRLSVRRKRFTTKPRVAAQRRTLGLRPN